MNKHVFVLEIDIQIPRHIFIIWCMRGRFSAVLVNTIKVVHFLWCYNGPRAGWEFLVMLVAITDIYYSMFILLALLPLLMIKNSLFVVMVVRIGKISISVSIKTANIEEISYRMKKLVSPIPTHGRSLRVTSIQLESGFPQ